METEKFFKLASRQEIRDKFKDLIEKKSIPEDISTWAWEWILKREENNLLEKNDDIAWEAIGNLAIADVSGYPDREYLYGDEDFKAWSQEFEQACKESPLPDLEIQDKA